MENVNFQDLYNDLSRIINFKNQIKVLQEQISEELGKIGDNYNIPPTVLRKVTTNILKEEKDEQVSILVDFLTKGLKSI